MPSETASSFDWHLRAKFFHQFLGLMQEYRLPASSISPCNVSRAASGSPISIYILAKSYLASNGVQSCRLILKQSLFHYCFDQRLLKHLPAPIPMHLLQSQTRKQLLLSLLLLWFLEFCKSWSCLTSNGNAWPPEASGFYRKLKWLFIS